MVLTKNNPIDFYNTARTGHSEENKRRREPDVIGKEGGSFPKPASLDVDNGGSTEKPEDEVKRKTSGISKAKPAGASNPHPPRIVSSKSG